MSMAVTPPQTFLPISSSDESLASHDPSSPSPPLTYDDGLLAPHSEDTWTAVAIGGVPFTVTGSCARCAMIDLDPDTGGAITATTTTTTTTTNEGTTKKKKEQRGEEGEERRI